MKDNKAEYFEISDPKPQSRHLQSQESLEKLYFFIQGIAALLPWSSILCTLDFYSFKFPNDDTSFTFPVAFFVSGVSINFLMVYIKRRFSLNFRVIGGLLLLLVLLILLPISAQNFSDSSGGLWTCFILLFLIGAANTVSNASVAGISGHFPPFCRSIHSTGAGFAALITNIIRTCIILASDSENPATDTGDILFFYGVAVLLLVAGIVLHVIFIQSNNNIDKFEEGEDNSGNKIQQNLDQQIQAFKQTGLLIAAMFITNTQTFMLYPGVLFQKPLNFTNFSWVVIIICTIFNLSDTLGKYLSFINIFLQKRVVLALVAIRFIFFILFLWPVYDKEVALLSETWFFLLMIALFGFTNGIILSCVFIMAPDQVRGEKKRNCRIFSV